MSKRFLTRAAIGILLLGTPLSAGLAQMAWVPGSEISGHAVQVTTNGTVNTVYFDPGGVARIQSPGGNIVPATWSAANGQLCLQTGGAQECWNYNAPFQAGQQMTLTSSCGASSWVAMSTAPQPVQDDAGERG